MTPYGVCCIWCTQLTSPKINLELKNQINYMISTIIIKTDLNILVTIQSLVRYSIHVESIKVLKELHQRII